LKDYLARENRLGGQRVGDLGFWPWQASKLSKASFACLLSWQAGKALGPWPGALALQYGTSQPGGFSEMPAGLLLN